ncbi:MAG: hypothetical protein QOJ82_1398 [Solirubrobacteraceae bacterium]|jgi:hypothetical protein|nr:hypothetical protein [Solirubrobacteraceae bacterium]
MSTIGNARRIVAVFDSYADAQLAVDHLSDQGFPVERVTIVGHGLRYIEQIVGRMTIGRAALIGAAQGAALGVLFGLLFGIVFTISPNPAVPLLMLYGLAGGAVLGAGFGLVAHALTGGRRDFNSVPSIQAERYELVVDEDVADQAAELLRAFDAAAVISAAPASPPPPSPTAPAPPTRVDSPGASPVA